MSLTLAPHISEVKPESEEFRSALATAGVILAGSGLNVNSRHHHYSMGHGEILFEELVMPGKLALYPVSESEATEIGLPSCWAFEPDGAVVVQRYASRELHKGSGVDVASQQFQAQLGQIGQAFAASGLHTTLELSITNYLFPSNDGMVAIEETDVQARRQHLTLQPMSAASNRTIPTSWRFTPENAAILTAACTIGGDDDSKEHR